LGYLPLDMRNGCDSSVGVCYSPARSDKIRVVDLSFHQSAFACVRLSCRRCCSSHSSVIVGHNLLDQLILLIQHHMADVMMKVALSADVTGLATAVAGVCEGFEGPSAVNVHRNAGRECARRGVHCCRGRSGGSVCVEE
jgi:hypothetical protein